MLSMAVGITVSAAGASGESTTAVLTSPLSGSSATFTWSYDFHDNGGHDLSNIAISFCSTDMVPHVVSASPAGEAFTTGDVPGGHTGFGPGVKFATTAVSGTLTVVFDQPYPAAGIMSIQSHSGDGDDGDLVTTADGPGTCKPVTTTTVAPTTTTIPATTTTVPATTTTVPATTTTIPATTTTVPATTTTVAVTTTTVRATTTTAPATTTTAPATTSTSVPTSVLGASVSATTSTSVPTSVLGARFSADDPSASLVKTGFSSGPLFVFGVIVLLLGVVLLLGDKLQPQR
jgi:hypothetical protein